MGAALAGEAGFASVCTLPSSAALTRSQTEESEIDASAARGVAVSQRNRDYRNERYLPNVSLGFPESVHVKGLFWHPSTMLTVIG